MIQEPAFNHQKGLSIVFVLILVGSTLLLIYALSFIIHTQTLSFHQQMGITRLNYISSKIFAILQNDSAWIITQNNNNSMSCLSNNSCSSNLKEFDLYRSDGTLLIRSDGYGEGFSLTGQPCSELGYSFNIDASDFNCPFAIKLLWQPSTSVLNNNRISIQAKITSTLNINTLKFEQILTFVRGEYLETIDANCSKLGGSLNQVTSICELPFQTRSCLNGQKIVGVNARTGLLECMDLPSVNHLSCPSGATGMHPDGSLICL